MSHAVRFNMKHSTVFSPVNTKIVLKVLPEDQKLFIELTLYLTK